VSLEDSGGGELTELMANHVLSDMDGDKRLTIVHIESVADEVRSDGRATGPGLDGLPGRRLDRLLDFFEEVVVNKEAFFDGTSHGSWAMGLLLATWLAAVVAHKDLAVGELGTLAGREALRELTPRRY